VIPPATRYVRPESVEEALEALARPEASALAGGQSLLPAMKLRLARPGTLVDIARLQLDGIESGDGELRIGALTTWDELSARPLRRPGLEAIAECASGIGDLQVRNRGTIGGGVAHADPASDMPAVLLALGARLRLRSSGGDRELAADDAFLGPFTTALEAGELITEVVVPVPPDGSGSAYVSVEHPASGFALAGAAALVGPDGGTTLAVTGVAGRPTLLTGETDLSRVDVVGDRFAPVRYRRHLAEVVCRRAVEKARARARESA
jgi:carbon-monoxide dehydrogenase medium subunit